MAQPFATVIALITKALYFRRDDSIQAEIKAQFANLKADLLQITEVGEDLLDKLEELLAKAIDAPVEDPDSPTE